MKLFTNYTLSFERAFFWMKIFFFFFNQMTNYLYLLIAELGIRFPFMLTCKETSNISLWMLDKSNSPAIQNAIKEKQ